MEGNCKIYILQLPIEEYLKGEHNGEGSYEIGRQPAYINGNCYFNGAETFNKEKDNIKASGRMHPQRTYETDY